ncbi:MAG: DNA-processing protein DprA [Deltaproteobacteria bacterium]|nr:DNA-processing protein DprA [Deltaproteobacteria bacterium]MBN2845955.1 DNA-processing protein DprA [Deltaproteobacteria bacterium]
MSYDTLKYWLALKFIEDIGNVTYIHLIDAFGSPRDVFDAPVDTLTKVPRITKKIASAIKGFDNWEKVESEYSLAEKSGVTILPSQSPFFPRSLLNIYDYPPLLYVKGTLLEEDIYIAVVGSRIASTYGKFTTERLCRELAFKGITTVSGMARGIDSSAHRGSLSGNGRTVAVLGSGIDVIYPPENKDLYEKIAENGAVITEFPFSTLPKGPHFPARNRIISGMSLGVVVVEANEKSGSLITARTALEQGREVFAVPGSIDSPGTKGTHKLIRDGAKLIENVYDILEEVLPQIEGKTDSPPSADSAESGPVSRSDYDDLGKMEREILDLMEKKSQQIDSIITKSGRSADDILNTLLSLELKGYIEQLPGKHFIFKE